MFALVLGLGVGEPGAYSSTIHSSPVLWKWGADCEVAAGDGQDDVARLADALAHRGALAEIDLRACRIT